MSRITGSGVFGLSIDVQETVPSKGSADLEQLLKALRRVRIPATLSTPLPGNSGMLDQLRVEPLRHEIGILADSSWIGPLIGRTQFARELTNRVESAKANGASVHSIALQNTELTSNLDLLVKHRISVVRSPRNIGFQPQSLRFGVWQAPVSFTLPASGRRLRGGVEWTFNRALSRAARTGGLVHLVVKLSCLRNQADATILERILSTVQRRRDKGLIEAVTMQRLVARLAPQPRQASAQSVLRRA